MSNRAESAQTDAGLGMEAAEWLLRLEDEDTDGEDEFADATARNAAFLGWIGRSPEHLRIFLETVETHRRLPMIDSRRLMEVEALLSRRSAEVIPLPGSRGAEALSPALRQQEAAPLERPARQARRNRALAGSAIAAAVLMAVGAGAYSWIRSAGALTTAVGEQHSTKLEDGSFIYLNTDSRIEVDFTKTARNIRLIRGEALFVVERDSARPFTVQAGDATVRALGTQFNVRRRKSDADVSVVEGAVQITALDEPRRLIAGEEAKVVQGMVVPQRRGTVAEAVAWRQRRLVFHDEKLVDVAAEFNRYNRTRIRVEGAAARDIQLSGIFDADRPQALMLYAAKNEDLVVEPDGKDWVIRGR